MNVQLTSELPAKYKNLIPIAQASSPPAGGGFAPPPPASGIVTPMRVKALFPFQVVQPGDLALDEGDVVVNVKKDSDTWWSGELRGARGVFPANYVEVLPDAKPAPPAPPAAATPPPPPASKKPPPPAGTMGKPPPLPPGGDDDEDGPPPPPPPRNPPKFATELTARVPASQGSQTATKPSAVAAPPAAGASGGVPAWKLELERRQAAKAAAAPAPVPAAAPAAAAAPPPPAPAAAAPPAAASPLPPPPAGGPVSGGRKFSGTTMEDLRIMLANFAQERDWDLYHKPRNLIMALTGEVGELAEIFQWKTDAEADVGLPGWSAADRERVEHELSDVLLYLLRIADRCDVDLPAAAVRKIALNGQKYPVEKARGSAKKYNQL